MLKSRTGYDQSVQIVTCAIWGRRLTFVMVKNVSYERFTVSTWKYGRSSVAAGATLMSHESSLFVVVGATAGPGNPPRPAPPKANVALGCATAWRPHCANAEPAIRRVAVMASVKSFFICFLLHTSWSEVDASSVICSPSLN